MAYEMGGNTEALPEWLLERQKNRHPMARPGQAARAPWSPRPDLGRGEPEDTDSEPHQLSSEPPIELGEPYEERSSRALDPCALEEPNRQQKPPRRQAHRAMKAHRGDLRGALHELGPAAFDVRTANTEGTDVKMGQDLGC